MVLDAFWRGTVDDDGDLHNVLYLPEIVFGEIELGGGVLDVVRSPCAMLRATTHPIPEIAKTRNIRFRSRDDERIRVVWA